MVLKNLQVVLGQAQAAKHVPRRTCGPDKHVFESRTPIPAKLHLHIVSTRNHLLIHNMGDQCWCGTVRWSLRSNLSAQFLAFARHDGGLW